MKFKNKITKFYDFALRFEEAQMNISKNCQKNFCAPKNNYNDNNKSLKTTTIDPENNNIRKRKEISNQQQSLANLLLHAAATANGNLCFSCNCTLLPSSVAELLQQRHQLRHAYKDIINVTAFMFSCRAHAIISICTRIHAPICIFATLARRCVVYKRVCVPACVFVQFREFICACIGYGCQCCFSVVAVVFFFYYAHTLQPSTTI